MQPIFVTPPSATLEPLVFGEILPHRRLSFGQIERIQTLFGGKRPCVRGEQGKLAADNPCCFRPASHYFWPQWHFHPSFLDQTKLIFIGILHLLNHLTTCLTENDLLAVANDLWQTTPDELHCQQTPFSRIFTDRSYHWIYLKTRWLANLPNTYKQQQQDCLNSLVFESYFIHKLAEKLPWKLFGKFLAATNWEQQDLHSWYFCPWLHLASLSITLI